MQFLRAGKLEMTAALFSVIVAMAARVTCCFRNESNTNAQDTRLFDGGRRLTRGKKYINLIVYNDHFRLASFGGPDGREAMEKNTEEIMRVAIKLYKDTEWANGVTIEITMVGQEVLLHEEYPFPPAGRYGTPKVVAVNKEKWPKVNKDALNKAFGKWGADMYDEKESNVNKVNNWILLSGAWFAGRGLDYKDTLGYGTRGGLCHGHSSHIVRCRSDDSVQDCASTLSHELGHNLGMRHDDEDGFREIGRGPCLEKEEGENKWVEYVMTSRTRGKLLDGIATKYKFSKCSASYLELFLEDSNIERCMLAAPPNQGIRPKPICGNGFVEPGEECDCGQGGCDGLDKCCDENTCQLKPNYQCSALDACCNDNCLFKQKDAPCRNARGQCDASEVCTGESSKCPEDVVAYAGKKCTHPIEGVCYNEKCLSQEDACKNGNRTRGRNYVISSLARSQNNKCRELRCAEETESITTITGLGFVPDGLPCSERGMCLGGTCLETEMFRIHHVAQCGNGLTEFGEECDCGSERDPCCECKTCKLKQGKQCSSLDFCCTDKCKFKKKGQICQREGQCTEKKTCTGNSGICPVGVGKAVGTVCNDKKGDRSTCYAGMCVESWNHQCSSLNATYSMYSRKPDCKVTACQGRDLENVDRIRRNLDDGTKINDRTICVNGKIRNIQRTRSCAGNSFIDLSTSACQPCFPTCKTCSGRGSYACIECEIGSKDIRGLCQLTPGMQAGRPQSGNDSTQGQGGSREEGKKDGNGWIVPVLISIGAFALIVAIVGGYAVCRRGRAAPRDTNLINLSTQGASRETNSCSEGAEVSAQTSMPIGNLDDLKRWRSMPACNHDKYGRIISMANKDEMGVPKRRWS